jgi:hypothetical protein
LSPFNESSLFRGPGSSGGHATVKKSKAKETVKPAGSTAVSSAAKKASALSRVSKREKDKDAQTESPLETAQTENLAGMSSQVDEAREVIVDST